MKTKISLILPTYTENETLKRSVIDFQKTKIISEIIVVNNNAKFDVGKTLKGTKAKEIFEKRQGYGAAIRKGLKKAKGELIAICEPDGTFVASDILKLLSYAAEFDLVVGSRTTQELIWEGANMGFHLKWGNFFVAKIVQLLYNTISLTDVGCTFRIIKRSALKKISSGFKTYGGEFGLEMMLLIIEKKLSLIQIPINYKERPLGESTYSGDFQKALKLATKMIKLVLKSMLIHLNFKHRPKSPPRD